MSVIWEQRKNQYGLKGKIELAIGGEGSVETLDGVRLCKSRSERSTSDARSWVTASSSRIALFRILDSQSSLCNQVIVDCR